MADKKISALTAASTPLAGTEVLPIVQSGSTVKVAVSNLTAGRAVSSGNFTVNGTFDLTADTNGLVTYGRFATGYPWALIRPSANATGIEFRSNAGDAQLTITQANGNVGVSLGNLVVGTAGKGIDFSANSNAPGMTSELLTWYEEGTWTPTMTSASGTTTVNSSSARYTRIGDKVFVVFQINYSTDASVSTSDFTIGGLPFTSRSTFNSRGFVTSSNWTGSDYNDGYIVVNAAGTTISWAGRAVNQSSRTNAILLFSADYFAA